MANFSRKRKFVTRVPQLKVDAGLAPGTHVFELVVTDQAGNGSKAARVSVKIVRDLVTGPLTYRPGGMVSRPTVVSGGITTPVTGTVRPRSGGRRRRRPPNR